MVLLSNIPYQDRPKLPQARKRTRIVASLLRRLKHLRHPSSSAKSIHPQTQSPLFALLPAELRLEIFRLVLFHPPGIELGYTIDPASHWALPSRRIGLLLTCSRIHAEALPILYGMNEFIVLQPYYVTMLAATEGAPLIRRLKYRHSIGVDRPPLRDEDERRGLWRRYGPRRGKTELEDWFDMWESFKKMEQLEWLRLEIYTHPRRADDWEEREKELLMPASSVLKDGARGELFVTWKQDDTSGMTLEDMLKGWVITREVTDWLTYLLELRSRRE